MYSGPHHLWVVYTKCRSLIATAPAATATAATATATATASFLLLDLLITAAIIIVFDLVRLASAHDQADMVAPFAHLAEISLVVNHHVQIETVYLPIPTVQIVFVN